MSVPNRVHCDKDIKVLLGGNFVLVVVEGWPALGWADIRLPWIGCSLHISPHF